MVEFVPLASVEDVVAALGRDLTDSEQTRVDATLAKASELFRNAAHRTFTPGRKTVRLKVNGGEVRLPETPVVTVHTVTDDNSNPIVWTDLFGATFTVALLSDRFVRVDYEYGDAVVPELVVTTVAEMVARTFDVDKRAKAGMSQFQETTGPFSKGGTFASWAIGGQVSMSPVDITTAESFRPPRLSSTVVHQ